MPDRGKGPPCAQAGGLEKLFFQLCPRCVELVFFREEANCLADKQLCYVHKAVGVKAYANAHLGPGGGHHILPVSAAGQERGLRLFHSGMMRDVLPHRGERVAKGREHIRGFAMQSFFIS